MFIWMIHKLMESITVTSNGQQLDDKVAKSMRIGISTVDKNGNEIRVVGDVDEEVLGNIINGEQMTDGEESSYESQTDPSQMSQEPKKKESKVKQLLTSIKNKFDIILIEIQVYCTVPNHKVMIIMVLAIVNLILLGAIALVLRKMIMAE